MELVDRGTEKSVPLIGSEVEFKRYRCPDCGQAVRFERSDPDGEWSQTGL